MTFRNEKKLETLKKQKKPQEYEEKQMNEIKEDISSDLKTNVERTRDIFGQGESGDLIIRQFQIGGHDEFNAAIAYIDNMTDDALIDNFILRSQMMQVRDRRTDETTVTKDLLFDYIKKYAVAIDEIDEIQTMKTVASSMLNGDAVLLIDGSKKAFAGDPKYLQY